MTTWWAPVVLVLLGGATTLAFFYFGFIYPYGPGGMTPGRSLLWFLGGAVVVGIPILLFFYTVAEAFWGG